MRHGNYKTTLKHYTVLGLADTSKAIQALPCICANELPAAKAYGTEDPIAYDPQQYPP